MTKNLANVRVYGDSDSAVYVAPIGSSGPVALAPVAEPHKELGWLSEDGVNVEREVDEQTFRAWQGGSIVRKKKTSVDDSFQFQALEETALTLGLSFGDDNLTTVDDVTTISVTNQTAAVERAVVVDFFDGPIQKRYVCPSVSFSPGAIAHQNSEMTVYEFEATIQGDYEIVTNNPAAAVVTVP